MHRADVLRWLAELGGDDGWFERCRDMCGEVLGAVLASGGSRTWRRRWRWAQVWLRPRRARPTRTTTDRRARFLHCFLTLRVVYGYRF